MPALSLVGPSYPLRFGKADSERTINYMPVLIESGQGKGGNRGYLKQVPGLTRNATLTGAWRGCCVAREVLYVVAGSTLYRVSSSWAATSLGTVGGSSRVSMVVNNTQILIACGSTAHVYDLDSGALTGTPANWPGSVLAGLLDGFGVMSSGSQFYLTGNQDFTSIDPLDFATAEGSTGDIIGHIVKHRELILLKSATGEVWYDAGGSDFPLARNDGANIEIGCSATHSLQKKGGEAYWLGRDETGGAAVFSMGAYTPVRISNHALEEQLGALDDLSGAYAFTYSQEGLAFYVLQVPGLQTTWVYEVSSGTWHERAELVDGDYQPWRVTHHAFVYGQHVVGDADGGLYVLDPLANTNDGDTLVRDRITPHDALPSLARKIVGSLQIDCDVGEGLPLNQQASLMLRYSNDGGKSWGNWRTLTLGKVGEYTARARATMLGSARNRVWHIRVTDDVTCNLLSAVFDEV